MNSFRRIWCALLLVATSAALGAPAVGGQDLDKWMSFYYLHPMPDEVAEALRAIDSEGYFQNDDVQAPLSGFFAEVFRSNPTRLSEWVKPYEGRKGVHILYSALWLADSRQSKAALASLRAAVTSTDGPLIESLLADSPPSIKETTVDSPAVLDYLWGRFMGSGSEEPVLRVIQEIQPAAQGADVNHVLISGAARWSVSANARQHARVLEIVKAQAQLATPVAPILQQIVNDTPPNQ